MAGPGKIPTHSRFVEWLRQPGVLVALPTTLFLLVGFAGPLVIVTMENYLAPFGAWVTIIQGVVFVVCVLVFREGIVGMIARWAKRPL